MLRGFNYCIIDEVDSILVDEARTPLIISGPAGAILILWLWADGIHPNIVASHVW